jgi:excinuclease ABC subunit C
MARLLAHVVAALPVAPGVYRFRDARGRALYIGRAMDLRHRVASYWSDLGDRAHLRRMIPQIVAIEAIACDSAHEAAWLERNLLETAKPRWNRYAGSEVPTWLRLDLRPRAAGLSPVHDSDLASTPATGVRFFGPYLGGDKVREAVSGLHRVLPLPYTRDGMSGGERDLGRVRRAAAADRDWMLAATVAVLERDEAAVALASSGLAALRDRAADALAFELAARIQAELDALTWVVAPQRVTVDGTDDADVVGWADGLLVHGEVRGGRLRRWTQREASPGNAAPLVAATPDAWQAFARRNAALAAALVRAGRTTPARASRARDSAAPHA